MPRVEGRADGVRIREAGAADAEALATLSGQLGYPASAHGISRRLRALHDHGVAGTVLVAETPARRVAALAQVLSQWLVTEEPFAELVALVVAEDARSAGAGDPLLAAAEAWARGRGLHVMCVRSSVVRERAHRFHRREGYAEHKRQAVFVKRL